MSHPRAYYNENNVTAANVLRGLIKDGVIADGYVDDRSIKDVEPHDLSGFTQCHFFAGAGVWSVAARLAGWPDDQGIWSGSCPCQPFSKAGKGKGSADERHLWPDFFRLINACRPSRIVGEQVAGKAGYGWFDGVRSDLARENYTSRAVDIPALTVDSPIIRQRLYWVALAGPKSRGDHGQNGSNRVLQQSVEPTEQESPYYEDAEWVTCHDGKARRAKPGIRMLVNGMAGRADMWRIAGNSINPLLAAEVIRAMMETT
jgi:DNA (cytosine-5)-methyltransferase 1